MDTQVAKDGAQVSLRRMTAGDVMVLFEWQCHPDTRRFARNPKPSDLEGHEKWFAARVNSVDCLLYMILHDRQPAGMLRFDRHPESGPDVWEVSIIVASEMKGRGIGQAALALGTRLLPAAEIVADVLPGNEASRQLFQKSGYVREADGLYHSRPRSGEGGL